MTAQVFRNGQTPTFYVSDALSPSGGGIAGTFSSLTVPGVLSALPTGPAAHTTVERQLIVNQTSAFVDPVVINGVAASPSNEIVFTDPSAVTGAVGINTFEASPSMFVATSSGLDFKIVTNAIERLRVAVTGIADDPAADLALALVTGSTVLRSKAVSSGVFTSTWTTTLGWTAPAATSTMIWHRIGNIVHCEAHCTSPDPANGTNTATLTVPIARTVNFTGAAGECNGEGSFVAAAGAATFSATTVSGVGGSMTLVGITTLTGADHGAGAVSFSFSYTLS